VHKVEQVFNLNKHKYVRCVPRSLSRVRHEYLLSFPAKLAASPSFAGSLELREPFFGDIHLLSELMLDSYRGNIDYDGETIKEAISEVESYFTRKDSLPITSASTLALRDGRIASACLVSKWEKRKEPLVSYMMTTAELKGRGLATYVTSV